MKINKPKCHGNYKNCIVSFCPHYKSCKEYNNQFVKNKEDNGVIFAELSKQVKIYLEKNTVDDLIKILIKKLPKNLIYRIINKLKNINNIS